MSSTLRITILAFCVICICGMGFAANREPTPRVKDGKEYRQWWCPKCDKVTSAYGPPYICTHCGKVLY